MCLKSNGYIRYLKIINNHSRFIHLGTQPTGVWTLDITGAGESNAQGAHLRTQYLGH